MQDGVVTISILGTSFTIKTDEDPEYVQSLVGYLKEKINMISSGSSSKNQLQLSILASLLVIDELFQEKERKYRSSVSGEETGQEEEMSRLTEQMIKNLEKSLDTPNSQE